MVVHHTGQHLNGGTSMRHVDILIDRSLNKIRLDYRSEVRSR